MLALSRTKSPLFRPSLFHEKAIVHVGGEPFGSRYALQHDVASQPDVVLSSATSTTEALLQQARTIPYHFRNLRRSGRQRTCCEHAAAGQPTPQVLLISRARTGKWLELLPYAEIYLGPLGAAAAALAVEAIATSVGDTSELESAVGGFIVILDSLQGDCARKAKAPARPLISAAQSAATMRRAPVRRQAQSPCADPSRPR